MFAPGEISKVLNDTELFFWVFIWFLGQKHSGEGEAEPLKKVGERLSGRADILASEANYKMVPLWSGKEG